MPVRALPLAVLLVLTGLTAAPRAVAQGGDFVACPQRFASGDRSFETTAIALDRATEAVVTRTDEECASGAAATKQALDSGSAVGATVPVAPWSCVVQEQGASCFRETPERMVRVSANCVLEEHPDDGSEDPGDGPPPDDSEPKCAISEAGSTPVGGSGSDDSTTGPRRPEVFRCKVGRRKGRHVVTLSADSKGRLAFKLERRAGSRWARVTGSDRRMTEGLQRIRLPKRLRAGRYRVTVTPRLTSGLKGKPVRRAFRVR